MKITHKKFLSLLAAEIGQDEKITSIHLNGLISEIINTVEEGRSYSITGFGTFLKDGPELLFEPDSRLAAEINYNYEGMDPIDVNEAKSVVDDEPVEKPSKPTRKTETLIVDDGVADEEDPFGLPEEQAATPSVLLSGADEDDDTIQPTPVSSESAEQVDENDPFETDEVAQHEEDPDAEQPDDSEPFADTDAANTTGSVKKGIVFEFDEDAGILEEGDANAASTEAATEDEHVSESLPLSAGQDSEQAQSSETESSIEDRPGSDFSELDEMLASETPANSDESDDMFGSAGTDEEETLADAVASKSVPKPEPVIKVGNIAGKRRPVAESGAKNTSGGTDNQDNGAQAKSRPLPGDRRNGSSSTTLIAAAVALVAVIFGVWWFFLRDSGATGTTQSPVAAVEQTAQQAVNTPANEIAASASDDTPDGSNPNAAEPVVSGAENQDESSTVQASAGGSATITSTPGNSTDGASSTAQLGAASDPDVTTQDPLARDVTDPATADVTDWQEPRPVGSPVDLDQDPSSAQGNVSPFGLRGTAQPMNGRVFSIVVHSLPNRIDGNAQCDEIARLRLRCVVVEATVNGRITYRVGIGQFETYAEARDRVSELPEPYRSRNFPARIN